MSLPANLRPVHSGPRRATFDVLAAFAKYQAAEDPLSGQAENASVGVTRDEERLEPEPATRRAADTIVTLPHQAAAGDQSSQVIARIEGILEAILDGLLEDAVELSLPYRSRRARSLGNHAAASQNPEPGRIRFPGKTPSEGKKFGRCCEAVVSSLLSTLKAPRSTHRGNFLACLLCILRVSHEALVSTNIITKRSVLPSIFASYEHRGQDPWPRL